MSRWLVFGTFLLGCGIAAADLGQDAGIVLKVSGQVTYTDGLSENVPKTVIELMRIRIGDRFYLTDGAKLELLLTGSSRKETWKGPVSLELGAYESLIMDGESTPLVENYPLPVAEAITRSELPLPRSQMTQTGLHYLRGERTPFVRSPWKLTSEDHESLKEARSRYAQLQQGCGPEDPLPDLYILSELSRYEQYAAMEELLTDFDRKFPNHLVVSQWQRWLAENYPIRQEIFILTRDQRCITDRDCVTIGNVPYTRRGPLLPSDLTERSIPAGARVTFTLTNTSEADYFIYLVNDCPGGLRQVVFPKPGVMARIGAMTQRNLYSDDGFCFSLSAIGKETLRLFAAKTPLEEKCLLRPDFSLGPYHPSSSAFQMLELKLEVQ